ncbi:MAG: hypothetical protein KF901_03665 [Myxococcales bacterium]|nr:hypothetical protein [Myxococcales bacterium]
MAGLAVAIVTSREGLADAVGSRMRAEGARPVWTGCPGAPRSADHPFFDAIVWLDHADPRQPDFAALVAGNPRARWAHVVAVRWVDDLSPTEWLACFDALVGAVLERTMARVVARVEAETSGRVHFSTRELDPFTLLWSLGSRPGSGVVTFDAANGSCVVELVRGSVVNARFTPRTLHERPLEGFEALAATLALDDARVRWRATPSPITDREPVALSLALEAAGRIYDEIHAHLPTTRHRPHASLASAPTDPCLWLSEPLLAHDDPLVWLEATASAPPSVGPTDPWESDTDVRRPDSALIRLARELESTNEDPDLVVGPLRPPTVAPGATSGVFTAYVDRPPGGEEVDPEARHPQVAAPTRWAATSPAPRARGAGSPMDGAAPEVSAPDLAPGRTLDRAALSLCAASVAVIAGLVCAGWSEATSVAPTSGEPTSVGSTPTLAARAPASEPSRHPSPASTDARVGGPEAPDAPSEATEREARALEDAAREDSDEPGSSADAEEAVPERLHDRRAAERLYQRAQRYAEQGDRARAYELATRASELAWTSRRLARFARSLAVPPSEGREAPIHAVEGAPRSDVDVRAARADERDGSRGADEARDAVGRDEGAAATDGRPRAPAATDAAAGAANDAANDEGGA